MRPAIASISLGRVAAGHALRTRLEAAAEVGFEGIEIVWECLVSVGDEYFPQLDESERCLKAAELISQWCKELKLEPFAIQAFAEYDGLASREQHNIMIEKVKLWMRVCQILGCSMLQVPANFGEPDSGVFVYEDDAIARDLRELAELAPKGLIISYEPMAWSTHVDTWDHALDIIRKASHKSLALCFDTYHWAGREYGDPMRPQCRSMDADKFPERLQKFRREVSASDISYVQFSDVELLDPPMPENKLYNFPPDRPRMTWSRNCRIFAWEANAALTEPHEAILEALVDIGYDGWLSHESFHKTHWTSDPEVPKTHAARAWQAHLKTVERVKAYTNSKTSAA